MSKSFSHVNPQIIFPWWLFLFYASNYSRYQILPKKKFVATIVWWYYHGLSLLTWIRLPLLRQQIKLKYCFNHDVQENKLWGFGKKNRTSGLIFDLLNQNFCVMQPRHFQFLYSLWCDAKAGSRTTVFSRTQINVEDQGSQGLRVCSSNKGKGGGQREVTFSA